MEAADHHEPRAVVDARGKGQQHFGVECLAGDVADDVRVVFSRFEPGAVDRVFPLEIAGENWLVIELNLLRRAENSQPFLLRPRLVEIGDFDPPFLDREDRLSDVVLLFHFALERHRLDGHLELAGNLRLKRQIDGGDLGIGGGSDDDGRVRVHGGRRGLHLARLARLLSAAVFDKQPHGDFAACHAGEADLRLDWHDLALEGVGIDLKVVDGGIHRVLREAGPAETNAIDRDLPFTQAPCAGDRIGIVGAEGPLSAVAEQEDSRDPLALRFVPDPIQRGADRRLPAVGLVDEPFDAGRLLGEVDEADVHRLAELVQDRAALLHPVEDRPATGRSAGAVLRVHALAGVAQKVKNGPRHVRVAELQGRPQHRQRQGGDGSQPKRQQQAAVQLRKMSHARDRSTGPAQRVPRPRQSR